MVLLDLFLVFLKVGTFTIGGGYAMVPLIQSEVVDKKKWMSQGEFVDAMAVAQSSPGVLAVNMSAFVGYRKAGVMGAVLATLGSSLPAIIPIVIIAAFFNRFMDIAIVKRIFMGLRPAVAALIVYAVYKIAKAGNIKTYWYILSLAAAIGIIVFKLDPILIIIASALLGIVFGRRGSK